MDKYGKLLMKVLLIIQLVELLATRYALEAIVDIAMYLHAGYWSCSVLLFLARHFSMSFYSQLCMVSM